MSLSLIHAALLTLFSQPAPAEPAEARFEDRYGVVVEQSIFRRDRSVQDREADRAERPPSPPPPPPPVEARYVLLGVVEEGAAFRAFVEDRAGSSLRVLRTGDRVAQGRVAAIDLDGLVYEAGESRTPVKIGQDLRGRAPSGTGAAPAARAEAPDTAEATPPAAAGSGEGEMSIEERMRQRRRQELER